ncbi:MAG: hypothetical protein IKX59_07435 [Bacteroidales bacterium]|nr:hypothetical protein [Bacteroidales bacterium]
MRTDYLTILFCLLTMNVSFSCCHNGDSIDEESNGNNGAYGFCPDDNHPHKIDLRLPSGTKWSCCNVGANTPEEHGGFFAWGEVKEKSSYSRENYEYDNSYEAGFEYIGDDIAGTIYDVAYVNSKGKWRMPSLEQVTELIIICDWEWRAINGVNGQLVIGPNGNTIFLPASGWHWDNSFQGKEEEGFYFTSTLSSYNDEALVRACGLEFNSKEVKPDNYLDRSAGCTVRPVCP